MIALIACAVVCHAQTQRPALPAGVQALADAARALPAEYTADALLRLAASGAVSDPRWKRELLEEAFAAAPNARNTYKLRFAGEPAADTREWILGQAFDIEVDTLSLQCRAVRGMFALDRRRAREMFARIPPLALPPPDCGSPLAPDLKLFYQTLEIVAGGDAEIVAARIRLISSPAELAPAAALIRSVKVSTDNRRALVTAYAERLAAVARNSGSLGFAARDSELASQPVVLAEAARREGIAVDALMRAYRDFLVAYLGSARCGERIDSLSSSWLEQFNERLRLPGYLVTTELPAISPDDIRPASVEPLAAKRELLYTSPKAKELEALLQRLRTGGGEALLPVEQRTTPDWQAEADRFVGSLEGWTPAGGEAAVHFHEKAGFYIELLEMAPAGSIASRIARSCVALFSDNPLEKTHPIEYLFELQRVLKLARTTPVAAPRTAGPFEAVERPAGSGAAIASELANSRDPVIALYTRLD